MLANLNDVLKPARREGYAVGLFNTVNFEMARGVIAAAEEARSPVIIGTAEILLPIQDIAAEMLAYQSDFPIGKVKDLFRCETGYQTPKLETL